MKKLNLINENGKIFSVDVVRYFRFKKNNYLIYTMQEKDDRDYMKLYVVKIMNVLNEKVSQTVRRNDEWKLMKGIVKNIITQIRKHNLTCIEDLDISEIDEMIIFENKSFFIASDLVEILATEVEKINEDFLVANNVTEENALWIQKDLAIDSTSNQEIEEIEILELDDELNENSTEEQEEIEILEL